MTAVLGTTTNDAIRSFCQRNLGRRVGNGQCAALAAEALKVAHAFPKARFANGTARWDYVWGQCVYGVEVRASQVVETGSGRDVKPGDIVQFHNVVFEESTPSHFYREEALHHTAVVDHVSPDGLTCYTWEQNANDHLYVTKGQFALPLMKQGWLKVYRPIPSRPVRSRR